MKLLTNSNTSIAQLQKVFEESPEYALCVTGLPPHHNEARDMFYLLPQGKTYEKKYVFGLFMGEKIIGCIDIVRGYPDAGTAFLGLLLISEKHQRKGFGREAYHQLEAFTSQWKECFKVRLAVVACNPSAIDFWTSLGFIPTGERTEYNNKRIQTDAILFEKQLRN